MERQCWLVRWPINSSYSDSLLDGLIHTHSFVYHLFANDSQVYFPAPDLCPELQAYAVHCPLDTVTWISQKVNPSKAKLTMLQANYLFFLHWLLLLLSLVLLLLETSGSFFDLVFFSTAPTLQDTHTRAHAHAHTHAHSHFVLHLQPPKGLSIPGVLLQTHGHSTMQAPLSLS